MSCDYSIYQQDFEKLNCDLTLENFRRSVVLLSMSTVINNQANDLYTAIIEGLPQRCLEFAFGEQLDVIGEIIGQDRVLENFSKKNWFQFDELNLGFDAALFYVTGAPVGGDLPADDVEYRQLIKARSFKNHVKYGSVPEIMQFAKILYNIDISIRKEGLSDLTVIVPESTPFYIIQNLISFKDTLQNDKEYFLPIPATGRLVKYIRRLTPPFSFDREGEGFDEGKYSVDIII